MTTDGQISKNGLDINSNQKTCQLLESNRALRQIVAALFSNRFEESMKMCDPKSETDMHYALAKAFIHCLYAFLTFELDEIQKGLSECDKAEKLAQCKRKKYSVSESLSSWFGRTDYDSFTDEEAAAELIYADTQIISGLLTTFSGHTLTSLIKAAFKMRASNQSFKLCEQILKSKTNWTAAELKDEVDAGTCLGAGFTNLVLSNFPDRILKFLSYVGFTGDFNIARDLLKRGLTIDNYQSSITALATVFYNLYMGQIFGLGDCDVPWSDEALGFMIKHFPNGSLTLFMHARLERLKGNVDKALELYERSIGAQNEWKQIHNICRWDMVWCHSFQENWTEAALICEKLKKDCDWSKAVFIFQQAIFNTMLMEKGDRPELKKSIDEDLKTVPTLRKRYGGRSMPQEKLAVVRAEEFLDNKSVPNFVTVCELYYVWNLITTESAPHLVEPILKRLTEMEEKGLPQNVEQQALLYLFKGVGLRNLGKYEEAFSYFKKCSSKKDKLPKKSYVPAHVALETGLTYLKTADFSSAKQWLTKARDDYSKYLIETVVHLRVHAALKLIKKLENS